MRINVDGKLFQQQLTAVSKVINGKNTLTILDNFLLSVEGDRLSITGSDQENVLTAFMPVADSDGDGSVAVPAKRLLEITKEISNQPLTIEVDDETKAIDLSFLSGQFRFMGRDADEYPRMRTQSEDRTVMVLPTSVVLKGLEYTSFAVSPDVVRPIMTGILWDVKPDNITFVSSDTHKLVRYINSERAPEVEKMFVMPAKVANIIRGLIGNGDMEIRITFDEKGGTFEFGDYNLSCLFIQGSYPQYNRVIPASNPFTLTVDRDSLMAAIRRVNLFAAKNSRLIVLDLSSEGLKLTSQDYDYGMSAEEKVACTYEGNAMSIGFNGLYMAEILANLKDDEIMLSLSDPARPGVYSPIEQKPNENVMIVQMPMQVI